MIPSTGGTPPPNFSLGRPPDSGSREVELQITPPCGEFQPQAPESGCSSDGGGVARGKIAVQASTTPQNPVLSTNFVVPIQGSDPPLPKHGSSSRRFSPYGSNKGSGALRGKGKGVNRKEQGQKKYSPVLSDLKVSEFIQGTSAMGVRRKGEESLHTIGSHPLVDGSTVVGSSSLPTTGETTVMDTEMDGLKHTSIPANFQVSEEDYGMFSPRKNSSDIQSIFWDASKGHYNLAGGIQGSDSVPKNCELKSSLDNQQKANSVWTSPISGFESFAEKIKKSNEISGLKLEYFPPSLSPEGGCRILISQDDLKLSAQVYSLHLYGYFLGTSMDYRVKCSHRPKDMEQVTCKLPLEPPPVPGPQTATTGSNVTPAVNKTIAPIIDKDGPIGRHVPAGQNVNQLGKAPLVNQTANLQGAIKPPTGLNNNTKKGFSGFNFARAVQGDRGGKNHQQPSTKKAIDVDTSNRFAVLDIPNSIKFNKVIEIQDDLYPPDQSVEDGMELDRTRSNDDQIMAGEPSQLKCGTQDILPGHLPVCQVNREFREGVRIIPNSITTPPKEPQQLVGHEGTSTNPVREGMEEKDYGISNAQKLAITSRLNGPAQAVRAVDMDMWEQGEHEFFEDQVKVLGLDYDYCIEDVDSDNENGTAQFFAAQMKVGMPKDETIWDGVVYREVVRRLWVRPLADSSPSTPSLGLRPPSIEGLWVISHAYRPTGRFITALGGVGRGSIRRSREEGGISLAAIGFLGVPRFEEDEDDGLVIGFCRSTLWRQSQDAGECFLPV
ncbi:hypothetical protein L1987_21596 [Smallanthus sonchifolius]|uniref:Uncharacterized protein n=1 Tax=Smallanthus sonchifolius TaxID=185202 RepID=A0ACB9IDU8_9ASTR|nr:hypothetical protein L1987_21596 [Smallanthus sonchifolius]